MTDPIVAPLKTYKVLDPRDLPNDVFHAWMEEITRTLNDLTGASLANITSDTAKYTSDSSRITSDGKIL